MKLLNLLAIACFALLLSCQQADHEKGTAEAAKAEMTVKAPLQLIIIGGPGAGKGTQARRIKDAYGIAHISTGAILRQEVADSTELGMKVQEVMARGDLVADDIILNLIEKRLKQPDCDPGFILDGFPRTLEQAQSLAPILQRRGNANIKVLLLEVSDEEMEKRLLGRGRADDTAETIKNRIAKFHRETSQAINYYQQSGILIRVNGEQSIEDVAAEIDTVLK